MLIMANLKLVKILLVIVGLQRIPYMNGALKRNLKYERNRNNFLRLCRSCHRRYDLTKDKLKQAIQNLWWKRGIKNPGKGKIKKYEQQ